MAGGLGGRRGPAQLEEGVALVDELDRADAAGPRVGDRDGRAGAPRRPADRVVGADLEAVVASVDEAADLAGGAAALAGCRRRRRAPRSGRSARRWPRARARSARPRGRARRCRARARRAGRARRAPRRTSRPSTWRSGPVESATSLITTTNSARPSTSGPVIRSTARAVGGGLDVEAGELARPRRRSARGRRRRAAGTAPGRGALLTGLDVVEADGGQRRRRRLHHEQPHEPGLAAAGGHLQRGAAAGLGGARRR